MYKVKYDSTYRKGCESRGFKTKKGAQQHANHLRTLADVKGGTVKVVAA